MFIKRIEFKNNSILWGLKLDFTLDNWEPAETIILWWENWTWKTTILEAIFSLWNYYSMWLVENEERIFELQLNERELNICQSHDFLNGMNQDSHMTLFVKFSQNPEYTNVETSELTPDSFCEANFKWNRSWVRNLFYSIYSDVWVNYHSGSIGQVTAIDVDQHISVNYKSSPNLSQEIKQLLVDINTQDALDFSTYYEDHKDDIMNKPELLEEWRSKRMKRFNDAFASIFPNKRFKEIRNETNSKEVIFEENGKECTIDQLSSWEKQIVFRGWFLLQNQNSINGNIVLIDEPEISLHPNWQLKILDFYKKIFQNESWQQTSQLIVVTHSPFIINNPNRLNDKVITLSKDNWKIIVDEKPKFFWFSTAEEFVSESFNINQFHKWKPIVLSEWKNYNYLIKAKEFFWQDLDIGICDTSNFNTGQLRTLFDYLKQINFNSNVIIFIWDTDYQDKFQWGLKDKWTKFLFPMLFTKNLNGITPWGIENMFDKEYFPDKDKFQKDFYQSKVPRNDWGVSTELRKQEFEAYVMKNTSKEMFKHFEPLFADIRQILSKSNN